MRAKVQGFCSKNHSWSVINISIARELIKQGIETDIISTDDHEGNCFPKDLLPYKKKEPHGIYSMQVSYTAPINFSKYLANGNTKRYGIWASEWLGKMQPNGQRISVLPAGFAKECLYPDRILAPSNFAKQVYTDGKVPSEKISIIPHGIDLKAFENKEKYQLKIKKKIKILAVIAQPHIRKNVEGLLEVYGRSFVESDDVALVLKVSPYKIKQHAFEVDFRAIFNNFVKKYPNHGKIEIIDFFIPSLVSLYNACDIVFTMSYGEAFYIPSLEALAAGKINVCPAHGGQLDFLNENNSVLISGREERVFKNEMYWQQSPYAVHFVANIDESVSKLRYTVNNYDTLLNRFSLDIQKTVAKLSWENIVKQILAI